MKNNYMLISILKSLTKVNVICEDLKLMNLNDTLQCIYSDVHMF